MHQMDDVRPRIREKIHPSLFVTEKVSFETQNNSSEFLKGSAFSMNCAHLIKSNQMLAHDHMEKLFSSFSISMATKQVNLVSFAAVIFHKTMRRCYDILSE